MKSAYVPCRTAGSAPSFEAHTEIASTIGDALIAHRLMPSRAQQT